MLALAPATLFRRCCCVLILFCIVSAAPLGAQTSIGYQLSFPSDVVKIQAVAPGQAVEFAFMVTSTDSNSGNALVSGLFESGTAVLDEYTFVALTRRAAPFPSCNRLTYWSGSCSARARWRLASR